METPCRPFEEIYDQYHHPITEYITRMVGMADAADVTQEIFAKVSRGLKRFEGRSKLSTWIYRIATHTALDRLRQRKRQPFEIPLMDELEPGPKDSAPATSPVVPSPLQQVIETEMNDCIREQMDKLPEKYRTVMILNALQELGNRDIADILDISVENVKIRLHRARAMLKTILESECRLYHNTDSGALSCDRKS